MSQIRFVTTYPEVSEIVWQHRENFPRSSLALLTIGYLQATHSPKGKRESLVMLLKGKPVVAIIGWSDDYVWDLIDRPAFLEFSQDESFSLGLYEAIKPLIKFIKSRLLDHKTLTLSFLEDGPKSRSILRELMSICRSHNLSFEGDVSLEGPLGEISQNFRPSHRQRIEQGRKILGPFKIFGKDTDPETFTNFRRMHAEAAGRVTRGEESWDEMYQGLLESKAFLGVASLGSEPVGYSYFWSTSHCAAYSSAAYNRGYFGQVPIAHFMLFESIGFFKSAGLKKLYVGEIFSPRGSPKEKSIAEFKRGFSKTAEAIHNVILES